MTEIPTQIKPFWSNFVATREVDPTPRFCDVYHFDDNEPSANELGELVLAGIKRATASLVWWMEAQSEPIPKTGDLNVITNWDGEPLCVVETRAVSIVPFNEVSEEFAAIEGEGNGSLQYWKDAHWAYFGRQCQSLGREMSVNMPVVCECFEVVYRSPAPQLADDAKLIRQILRGPAKFSLIDAGFSVDRKYFVEPAQLLRVCPLEVAEVRQAEFEAVGFLHEKGVKCAEAIRFGMEGGVCYCLYSYIEGESAADVLPALSETEQYAFGIEAGEQLALINGVLGTGKPVNERAIREPKFERYSARLRELKLSFVGQEVSEEFVRSHLHLLEGRPSAFRHGDFHPGNLIAKGGKLSGVIDFNRCDWGDPIDDFYKTAFFGAPVSTGYAQGLVKGYFGGEPPDYFWPLYNLYVAATLPGDIVWAEQLFPEELPGAFKRVVWITATHDFVNGGPPDWWTAT